MAEDPISGDQAAQLNKTLREMGTSLVGITSKFRTTNDLAKELVEFGEAYEKTIKRTTSYTEELIKDLELMAKTTKQNIKLQGENANAYKSLIDLAEHNSKVQENLQDMLREELQTRGDMLLQNTMLATGLEGTYAQMAATLALDKEALIDKTKLLKLEEELLQYALAREKMTGANTEVTAKLIQLKREEIELAASAETAETAYQAQIAMLQARQAQNKVVEEQNDLLKAQAAAVLKIKEDTEEYKKKAIETIATIKAVLSSPAAIAGIAIKAAGKMGDAFSEAYKELKTEGLSSTQAAHEAMTSFTDSMSGGFLTSSKSIRDARKAISDMGGTLHEAEEAGDDVANLVSVYGGSEAAAGKMYGTMTKVAGMTKEAALRAVEFGSGLSIAAGVPADTVTKAVAENTEAAALSGPKFADSFAKAAVNAKKLGIEFAAVTAMQKSLLDFESSINNQMEASVLLGREINLDKARELALTGDLAGMQAEILKQVGSVAEFDKMNVLQKEALAKSMGVSVSDMSKMVHGQAELTDLGKEAAEAEKQKASLMAQVGNFIFENAGAILGAVPGLVMTTAQLVAQLATMKAMRTMSGTPAKGGILGMLTGGLFGKKMDAPAPPTKVPKIPKTEEIKPDKGGGMLDKLQKIDPKKMLSAAAAIAAVGAALMLIGLGIKFASEGLAVLVGSFKGLSNNEMIAALGAILIVMAGFTAMVYILASASTAAALPLLGLGLAFLMIGGGIALAAVGIGYMVKQFGEIPYDNLMALPLAMLGIGAGLYMMGLAGLQVLPIIGALIALAIVAPALVGLGAALGGMFEKKESASTVKSDEKDPVAEQIGKIETAINNLGTTIKNIKYSLYIDSKLVADGLKLNN